MKITLCDQTQSIFKMAATKDKVNKKENGWVMKAKIRSKQNKLLRMELRRVRQSRDSWRQKYRSRCKLDQGTKVKGHRYSVELMLLGVLLNISYNISLRATANALYAMGLSYGRQAKRISAGSIRNWGLRLGLYFLTRALAPGRYVLIADESISIGQEKLLVLLAVRLDSEHFERISALQMSDVEVLHIQSKASWKGADIGALISKYAGQYPNIEFAYAISDQGSNLRNAFRLCGLTRVSDCTHLLSKCTQVLFQNDPELDALIQAMNASRAKWALSRLALYAPPALRKKARFHQIFAVYKWGDTILEKWHMLPQEAKDELAYVEKNRKLIQTMKQIHALIEDFSGLVKGKGINAYTQDHWKQKYEKRCAEWNDEHLHIDDKVEKYHLAILEFITQTKASLPEENQILCCSDVIESIFGKYKNKARFPMITDDALKIAAYPHTIQKEDIIQAMAAKSTRSIQIWKQENTTVSLLAQRRRFKLKTAA